MKGIRFAAPLLVVAALFSAGISLQLNQLHRSGGEDGENLFAPSDNFFLIRSYPDAAFSVAAYQRAMDQAAFAATKTSTLPGFDATWRLEGPSNIGGRINSIAIHPANANIIYAGCASGGIFKTTDGGSTWAPIFDNNSYLSIGVLTLDPANPDVIYAGTGDPNIGGYPFIGNGLFRSTDAGQTWTNLGLQDTRIISKIIVHPTNSSILYVATMGLPMQRNNDRGLYKSTDGGATWTQVLFVADQAGVTDLVMDPTNPDVLYAASWDRIRTNTESVVTGPNGKIWKTTDGGTTWTALGGGLPTGNQSRIGLCISPTNPDKLYAVYLTATLEISNIYKTTDGGSTWAGFTNVPTDIYGNFGWYFTRLYVNPYNDSELYVLGVELYRTTDDGESWWDMDNWDVHADKHDLLFYGPDSCVLATDGGLYRSTDGAWNWTDTDFIPNNQFYRVAVNPFSPDMYYGGVQDNGSNGGNASTIDNWQRFYGADGFQMRFDHGNPNVWYCEWQNLGLVVTEDNGSSFLPFTDGIDEADRRHWDAPFELSPHNSSTLYTGTYRVYRTTNGPVPNWQPVSPDLTDGIILSPRFHTLSALGESPISANILYAGTTDGNVWVTTNNCTSWNNITTGLPERYVTSVKASPVHLQTAFVTHSGYRDNEYVPHIHKTTDAGAHWTDITGDLPPAAVNDIVIHPYDEDVLFAGSDAGVYATLDGGSHWERLGSNMPIVAVYDMELDMVNHRLVAGTHGRSLMTFPLDSILTLTGLQPTRGTAQLQVWPNPAHEYLSVALPAGTASAEITLTNAEGKIVRRQPVRTGERVPVATLPAGTYVARVGRSTAKVVKE